MSEHDRAGSSIPEGTRYPFTTEEQEVLERFFNRLTAGRMPLRLAVAARRHEALREELVALSSSDTGHAPSMAADSMLGKLTAFSKMLQVTGQFLGKPVGKQNKRLLYEFDITLFVMHGDVLDLVVRAAREVKKPRIRKWRKTTFASETLPSNELICKVAGYAADFKAQQAALARGETPGAPTFASETTKGIEA